MGGAIAGFARSGEFAARLHTRGDEFCLLLPGPTATTERRAAELEAALDSLEVPETHRHVYRGASVGPAWRRPGETPGQTLGRASERMHARKAERRDERANALGDAANRVDLPLADRLARDDRAGVRRGEHEPMAQVDADVAVAVLEHQVAPAHLAARDGVAAVDLAVGRVRQADCRPGRTPT